MTEQRYKLVGGKTIPLTAEEQAAIEKEEAVRALTAENDAIRYKRKVEYGTLEEQLDMIFHSMDGWRKHIASVKLKYPIEA